MGFLPHMRRSFTYISPFRESLARNREVQSPEKPCRAYLIWARQLLPSKLMANAPSTPMIAGVSKVQIWVLTCLLITPLDAGRTGLTGYDEPAAEQSMPKVDMIDLHAPCRAAVLY